ncbi:MAG: hypothetical protein K2X93_21630 [Candidatus Obscuribacterales bacterium]|nr:hypothetical protein [Candidatus Obscuribacterales bacterium]
MMKPAIARPALSLLLAMVGLGAAQLASAQQPFKLGVEERGYLQNPNSGEYEYPAPQAVPTPQLQGNVDRHVAPPKKKPPAKTMKLQGGAQDTMRPLVPFKVQAQQSVALPQGFLGAWQVSGMRKDIQAQPQFQAAIPTIFSEQTQDIWNISGDPRGGYAFNNQAGVKSSIFVDKVQGDTAFIRYQHPIKNTMAQEAIVMQLVPGGAQFNGLERISIIKQGEPGPRAQVTYALQGRRR